MLKMSVSSNDLRRGILLLCLMCFVPIGALPVTETVSLDSSEMDAMSTVTKKGHHNFSTEAYEIWRFTTVDDLDPVVEMIEKVKTGMNSVIQLVMPYFVRYDYGQNTNPVCIASLLTLVMAATRLDMWALHMLDASGKVPAGMLRGTLASLGDYDQCLKSSVGSHGGKFPDEKNFRGKYCSVDITFKTGNRMSREHLGIRNLMRRARWHFGVCVPSTCTADDLRTMVESATKELNVNIEFNWCEVQEQTVILKTEHYVSGVFIIGAVLAVWVGTILHFFHKRAAAKDEKQTRKLNRIVQSLSVLYNGEKLLNAKFKASRLGCLNGMRFLTMCWIICTQVYYYGRDVHVGQIVTLLEDARSFSGQIFANSQPAVDTFFVISGMLVMYLGFQRFQETGGKINLHDYYIHRYFRLTPAFMMATAVTILLPLFGSGPMWKEYLSDWAKNCEQNWWTNLLYIGSWYNRKDMCLSYSWFLSVDMMFYLVSPAIMLLFYRHQYVALVSVPCAIAFSMIITGVVTFYYNIPPIPLVNEPSEREEEYLSYLQAKPFPHIAPYCVGIMLGYVLHKRHRVTINKILLIVGWFIAILSLFTIIYSPYTWNVGRSPTTVETILFAVFNKTGWSLGIAWIILMCATGNGGFINSFLSWSGFTLVGRLTYCAFLLHPLVIVVYNATSRSMETYRFVHFFLISLGSILATFTISFFVSLCFESPFLGVDKVQVAAPIINLYRRRKSSIIQMNLARRQSKLLELGNISEEMTKTETTSEH